MHTVCNIRFVFRLAVAAVVLGAVGCAGSGEVGLSNARVPDARPARSERGHDAIANGQDSCERPGSLQPDPAPVRVYPCRGVERRGQGVAALQK
jgi:hypothetical protein